MQFQRTLFVIIIAFFAGAYEANAKSNVIIYGGSTKGCVVKGIVRTTFEPPKTREILFGNEVPFYGFISPSVIEDLKRQAAALGANRIVFRDAANESAL